MKFALSVAREYNIIVKRDDSVQVEISAHFLSNLNVDFTLIHCDDVGARRLFLITNSLLHVIRLLMHSHKCMILPSVLVPHIANKE